MQEPTPKSPPPAPQELPSPRRLKGRAEELLREARRLHERRARDVSPEAASSVGHAIARVEALLPTRKHRVALDVDALYAAVVSLDHAVAATYGPWRKGPLRELVEALFTALLLAGVIRLFLIEAFSIPSSSMYPTLEIGDHLFISKIRYGLYKPLSSGRLVAWDQPSHGDVIVFEYRAPGEPLDGEDFIKRVVAVPGDRVRLEDDRLVLNGVPVQTEVVAETECPIFEGTDYEDTPRRFCPCVIQRETIGDASWLTQHITAEYCSPGTVEPSDDWPLEVRPYSVSRYWGDRATNPDFPDVRVPEGHVFVMGDNRDNSQDGRFWGFVPYERVKGKAFVVWLARDLGRLFTGL